MIAGTMRSQIEEIGITFWSGGFPKAPDVIETTACGTLSLRLDDRSGRTESIAPWGRT